jgi:acyl-CoA synthetase (AMP-forming)/AMP-acid ligase II
MSAPGVEDAAVIGVPDDAWGQRVVAIIVPGSGDFDLENIKAHIEGLLPGFKRPKQYHLVELLPRTASGKLRRSELARSFGG